MELMEDANFASSISRSQNEAMDNDDFEFETEILPLKGNKDYIILLRTLCILQSQRTRALKDIDKLLEIQDEALADPLNFVEKLKRGEDLGYNGLQAIPEVPEIDWSKYKISLPPEAFRPQTRNLMNKGVEVNTSSSKDVVKIRGRVYDDSKSVTFNQLWSVEEQLRLEELLMKYPQEDNETRRYSKIAKELGNRTVQQVSSRCQKYFRKLLKAGLPIPGRTPKITKSDSYKTPKYSLSKLSKNNMFLYPKSTFFPQAHTPVSMGDENIPGTSTVNLNTIKLEPEDSETDMDDEVDSGEEKQPMSEELRSSEEYKKMVLLKRVKREVEKSLSRPIMEHPGFMCDHCQEDPLSGTRWHCTDCDTAGSVDFCSDCLVAQLEGQCPHPLDHHLVAFSQPVGPNQGWDQDYSYQAYSNSTSNYNYLDPNFMPQ